MDASEAGAQLPGASKKAEKRCLEVEANEAVLPEHVSCSTCKRPKRKQTEPKKKVKCGNSKEPETPKAKTKGALRRQLIREKRAERKRAYDKEHRKQNSEKE